MGPNAVETTAEAPPLLPRSCAHRRELRRGPQAGPSVTARFDPCSASHPVPVTQSLCRIPAAVLLSASPDPLPHAPVMTVYGTALLAACHLLGIVLGDLLGRALGMKTNVGGVGLAMLLLIVTRAWLHRGGRLTAASEGGVTYWGAIYIPVVVAMAMQQNVVAALRGGPVALLAATATVAVCFSFVSFINRAEHPPSTGLKTN